MCSTETAEVLRKCARVCACLLFIEEILGAASGVAFAMHHRGKPTHGPQKHTLIEFIDQIQNDTRRERDCLCYSTDVSRNSKISLLILFLEKVLLFIKNLTLLH